MRRLSIIVMVLASLAFAGCTPAPQTPSVGPGPSNPTSGSVAPTGTSLPGTTTATPASPVAVRVYFNHDEKMQPVLRTLQGGSTATLKAALVELLAGPDAAETAVGMNTQIPAGTTLKGVTISGKTATIDLSAKFASGGGTMTMTDRLAQVVYTATQFSSVKNVKFRLDGKPVTVFGGEGIMLTHPQTRADYEYSTAAIFVDTPAWQAKVTKGMTAKGTANVFEATFRLQLRDSTGALLVDKTVHATSGTGTRGTWAQALTWTSAKAGPGELKVFAASAKDGTPIDVVTIPVVIP